MGVDSYKCTWFWDSFFLLWSLDSIFLFGVWYSIFLFGFWDAIFLFGFWDSIFLFGFWDAIFLFGSWDSIFLFGLWDSIFTIHAISTNILQLFYDYTTWTMWFDILLFRASLYWIFSHCQYIVTVAERICYPYCRYNICLSVTCDKSVTFSRTSGFLHK